MLFHHYKITECSIAILILFYYYFLNYLIHVKVIIESAFDSLLRLFEDWQCLNAIWQPCNRGNLQQSYSYDLLFPLNHVQPQPEPRGHERCARRVRQCQCLEVLWLYDKVAGGLLWLMHVMQEAFRVLFGTAVACSDNAQSNLTNRKEYTQSILFDKTTNSSWVSLTNQPNEWIGLCEFRLQGENILWWMLHEC